MVMRTYNVMWRETKNADFELDTEEELTEEEAYDYAISENLGSYEGLYEIKVDVEEVNE